MNNIETLEQFYSSRFSAEVVKKCNLSTHLGHFNVFKRGEICKRQSQFSRRDYYKISLVIGTGTLHLATESIEITGKALVFYNPMVPYTWEPISEKQEGYFCLFNRRFIDYFSRNDLFLNSPLFNTNLNPVIHLNDEQLHELEHIFVKMMEEVETDYENKFGILRTYLNLVLHEANKTRPANDAIGHGMNASSRISSLFIEMLERQFPVDSTEHALKLKTPNHFAEKLSVHVNHLNRAVKEITGQSTSEIIAERMLNEAKAMLRHTNNTIAEIAYSLGFEHPSNFHIFFKKQTGQTPKALRV
jgi:AraC family transcriptional activator of pobA